MHGHGQVIPFSHVDLGICSVLNNPGEKLELLGSITLSALLKSHSLSVGCQFLCQPGMSLPGMPVLLHPLANCGLTVLCIPTPYLPNKFLWVGLPKSTHVLSVPQVRWKAEPVFNCRCKN